MLAHQRHAELVGEGLREERDALLEAAGIIFPREIRVHRVADPAHARVGQKPLGPTARRDEDLAGAGPMVPARHEQHDDAEVLRGVARFPLRPDAPLPPDLHRHIRRRPVPDVREGDHGDLAAGLVAHLGDQRLHAAYGGGIEHPSEIVDVAPGGGDRDLREDEQQVHAGMKVHAGTPDAQTA